ncbi:MAG: hypothetical protein ACD_24C00409G0007 [uncultured bacterium]|uniref:Uncharacterized protein n=1 Tax=candidate division WWE3 bacterium RBG_16_37_10 TaxID=1802610 RepID=A0A1F4UWW3_UNCKA|nr:MAG: hypothetical protein ACD_24C00409G0007 [uncultured bacterium]OGC49386.1 MAG: hypothetical protein A2W32_04300 [candidate division WWE3 bacterium RBG_16_37_10]
MENMESQKPEKHTDLKHLLTIVLLLVLVGVLVVWIYVAAGPGIFTTKLSNMGNKPVNVTKDLTEADDSNGNSVKNDQQMEEELKLLDENSDLNDIDEALNQLEQVDLSDIEQTYQ